MGAREAPPEGWVTVAAAAEALSKSGDPIDPSNVSRYLARFPGLPQRKVGKYRYLDLGALAGHRQTNVLVGEKQAYREAPGAQLALQPRPSARPTRIEQDDEDLDDDGPETGHQPSELNRANVDLKRLKIREAQLDLAEREGKLVPDTEVLTLVSGVMQTFISELERHETALAASHGREIAIAVRRARKAAQAAASARLVALARKHLPAHLAAQSTALDAGEDRAA